MPQRSAKPGLKYRQTAAGPQPYWVAKQVVRDPKDFPDRTIRLPIDADEETLAAICRDHTARLFAWIESVQLGAEPGIPRYNGSVLSACRLYQEHPRSRFHKVARNTRKSYMDSLKIIESNVGARRVRSLTVLDVEHWYEEWRKPAETGGAERIDRAHDAVSMFKTVMRFLAALRHQDCKQLAEELQLIKFEKGGSREEQMTYAQVSAFIRMAIELGRSGIIPQERGLYMAIGTTAQFELLLRQKDIIGQWDPLTVGAKTPAGKHVMTVGAEVWSGYFAWENIPGWRWRMRTSKSKYRSAADFDLANYSLLMPLLEAVPREQRVGAIVKGEHGLPMRETSYRRWFRQIARAAAIPDEVWNMDTRAGGATEAEEAGAALEDIQGLMTHSKENMTLRYLRKRSKRIENVADARNEKRAADRDGGTA
jgi:site-specific recombinase XerD